MKTELVSLGFNLLSTRQLYEILKLREDIFIVEQNCPYHDIDGIDYDAIHVMCIADNNGKKELAAYGRVYMDKDNLQVRIGRVITSRQYRRLGMASKVMSEAISVACSRFNAKEIWIHAQTYAVPFYERAGFKVVSGQFLEDGIPHVLMEWNA